MRWWVIASVVLGGIVSSGSTALAQSQESVAVKYTQGTVSAVDKRGIAVERMLDEGGAMEMYLPFDPALKLQNLKSLSEIREGDTVLVDYRETTTQDGGSVRSSRVAVKVALVRRAAPRAAAGQEDQDGAGAPETSIP